MPSYAVLGATGNVGSALLEVLLKTPDAEVRAYVRSKAKLLRMRPDLADNDRVRIHEGGIDDIARVTDCISDTKAVFLAVGLSENVPYCTIMQDTAHSVLSAMKQLRAQDTHCRHPRLVVLSSASLDAHLCRDLPRFAHSVLLMGSSWIYADLRAAEELLRSQEHWVKAVFVKPAGLVHDRQQGHKLSTDRQQTFLSFLDLAGGMVEVAEEDDDYWEMKNVSVLPTAKDVKIEWWVPWYMAKGLLFHFCPGLYPYLMG